ncbi:hypothetical protein NPIL_672221 [Nephila pilipes]|uniref:Uncharacterized protein n=1 Tax=Nephila pilipes TaxID=299642 RepID=A0A8X6TP52_NEPPI|nr:hypothetical protein NPIL_672221 [Nephila pilipes]
MQKTIKVFYIPRKTECLPNLKRGEPFMVNFAVSILTKTLRGHSLLKKDICLFNLSDNDNECVSMQRLLQRKDSCFQFAPERVLLNGENLGKLRDSFELVFECETFVIYAPIRGGANP